MWSEFYVFDGTGLVKCGSMNGTPLRFLFTLQILRFGLVIFLTSVKPNKYEKFNEFFFLKIPNFRLSVGKVPIIETLHGAVTFFSLSLFV